MGLAAVGLPLLLLASMLGGSVKGSRFDLLAGSTWLPSSVGQAALISGASGRRVAAIAVGPNPSDLEVVNAGTNAYVVNHGDGTVRRVDGATFEVTPRVQFATADGDQLQLLTGAGAVFVLDGARGIVHEVDARTLAERGPAHSLEASVRPGAAIVDSKGRLWAIEDRTGDLEWLGHGSGRRAHAVSAGGTLVDAGSRTVLVGDGRAQWLDDDGSAAAEVDLHLPAQEQAVVSGTADGRLLVVVPSRGVLKVCREDGCDAEAHTFGGAGGSFGPAIELSGRYFVPDLSRGSVHLIAPARSQELSEVRILKPAARFTLRTQDKQLFYNDVSSQRAGVLHWDGTFTAVTKYDAGNPRAGLDGPATKAEAPRNLPGTKPDTAPAQHPLNQEQPTDLSQPNREGLDASNPGQDSTVGNGPGTAPSGKQTVRVTAVGGGRVFSTPAGINCPSACGAVFPGGTSITLTAVPTVAGSSVTWSGGCSGTSANCVVPPGGGQVTATFVGPQTKAMLTVSTVGNGRVTSAPAGIDCPGQCTMSVLAGSLVTLIAQPGPGQSFASWSGGDCPASITPCTPTVSSDTTVAATFTAVTHRLHVSISGDGTGSVTSDPAGITCPGTCDADFPEGAVVTLTASPDADSVLTQWTTCAGSGSCPLTMDTAHDVDARIDLAPDTVAPRFTKDPLPDIRQIRPAGTNGMTVSYATPGVTDDRDPRPTVSCSPASGTFFTQGDKRVNCTASDAAGNTTPGSFTVHVLAPVGRLNNSDVITADKWGVCGDMRAEYDVQVVPPRAGYHWDGQTPEVTVITDRPLDTITRRIDAAHPNGAAVDVTVHIGAPCWLGGPGIQFYVTARFEG